MKSITLSALILVLFVPEIEVEGKTKCAEEIAGDRLCCLQESVPETPSDGLTAVNIGWKGAARRYLE